MKVASFEDIKKQMRSKINSEYMIDLIEGLKRDYDGYVGINYRGNIVSIDSELFNLSVEMSHIISSLCGRSRSIMLIHEKDERMIRRLRDEGFSDWIMVDFKLSDEGFYDIVYDNAMVANVGDKRVLYLLD